MRVKAVACEERSLKGEIHKRMAFPLEDGDTETAEMRRRRRRKHEQGDQMRDQRMTLTIFSFRNIIG